MLNNPWLVQHHVYVPTDFAAIQPLLTMPLTNWQHLTPYELREAMLMLSQYYVYTTVLTNAARLEARQTQRQYQQLLNETAMALTGRTLKERQAEAESVPACEAARQQWEEAEERAALVDGYPEAIRDLLYSVRKAYDNGVRVDG